MAALKLQRPTEQIHFQALGLGGRGITVAGVVRGDHFLLHLVASDPSDFAVIDVDAADPARPMPVLDFVGVLRSDVAGELGVRDASMQSRLPGGRSR